LISIGGSSVADAAKLMALALSEMDSIDDFFRKYDSSESISAGRFDKPKLPLIAIPTTLAGAEYTGSAGVTNEVRHFKDTFRHASLTPRLVILDPETTIYTGKNLWSSTALKILADCFEACYSPQHQPVIDAMALHAARLINENLLASIEEPMNLGARALLQHASWMIAYGGWGSSVGMIGSLRHQIGAMHNVEHGIASTIVFPNGVEGNRPDIDDRLRLMAPSFNIIAGTKDAPGAVIERVRELIVKSGLPTKLRDVGIPEDALSAIAEASMKGAWVKNAPKPVTMDMLLTVLKKSW
jgi:alcohol dehydrogenase class IV